MGSDGWNGAVESAGDDLGGFLTGGDQRGAMLDFLQQGGDIGRSDDL